MYEINRRFRTTIQPYAEPIDVLEAKAACGIFVQADDSVLVGKIREARKAAEDITRRYLVVQTVTVTCDKFGGSSEPLYLPTPLISVDSGTYTDTSGVSQALTIASYDVDTVSEPSRLLPSVALATVWPSILYGQNRVSLICKAGYLTPFTVDKTTGVITVKGRTFAAADRIRLSNSGGKLPSGLKTYTDYFVRDVSGSTFKVELSVGGGAISSFADAGVGTQFVGELSGRIRDAMMLRIAASYEYPEGGTDYNTAMDRSNLMLEEEAVPELLAA